MISGLIFAKPNQKKPRFLTHSFTYSPTHAFQMESIRPFSDPHSVISDQETYLSTCLLYLSHLPTYRSMTTTTETAQTDQIHIPRVASLLACLAIPRLTHHAPRLATLYHRQGFPKFTTPHSTPYKISAIATLFYARAAWLAS